MSDPVNHPNHYQSASGFECIQFTSLLTFELGNALKYLWRAGSKGGSSYRQDLEKALTYVRMSADKHEEPMCPLYKVRREIFDLVAQALESSLPEERHAAGRAILSRARGANDVFAEIELQRLLDGIGGAQ